MSFFSVFQHIILGLKFLIAYAIPDIPETIETNRAKLEFLRREALKVVITVFEVLYEMLDIL